ncbi:hypothetical protein CDAR_447651 [Caerostris darwini]|uniref:Uncharacterized protein n=1 Tax=Caerostris darwini TaxID=1538125 RepID=A0AAV4PQK7_9ARAC|nr:hypothetical protein CDAR_447651 [Caerostris darwini]
MFTLRSDGGLHIIRWPTCQSHPHFGPSLPAGLVIGKYWLTCAVDPRARGPGDRKSPEEKAHKKVARWIVLNQNHLSLSDRYRLASVRQPAFLSGYPS